MAIERFTVRHFIPLQGAATESVITALKAKAGVKDVRMDVGGRVLVTYDLLQLRYDDIEAVAAEAGARLASGFLKALRRNWIRFNDETLRSSADLPASPCCGGGTFPGRTSKR